MFAANTGNVDLVQALIGRGADVFHRDGQSSLWFADDAYIGNISPGKKKVADLIVLESLKRTGGKQARQATFPRTDEIKQAITHLIQERMKTPNEKVPWSVAIRLVEVAFEPGSTSRIRVLCDAAAYDKVAMWEVARATPQVMAEPIGSNLDTHAPVSGAGSKYFVLTRSSEGRWTADTANH